MQVVGVTTQQYIYLASRRRKFRINEILMIGDPAHGSPPGEVVETKSFNRFVPLTMKRSPLIDAEVWQGLEQVGFNLGGETIHLARVRLLNDLPFPVEVGVEARVPAFQEVERLLLPCHPENGLVLGVLLGTEELHQGLPAEWQAVAPLYVQGEGLHDQNAVPFVFDYRAMQEYPHIGIFGGSGSGKSFGLRVILEELLERRVPGLVFDPHYEMSFNTPFEGADQAVAARYAARTETLTVGRDTGVSFEELNSEDLAALLKAAGPNFSDGMDNALKAIHKDKDSFVSFAARLDDLIGLAEKEEETRERIRKQRGDNSAYERMLSAMARQAGHPSSLKGIAWRLYRLRNEGIFQQGIEPIKSVLLRRKLAVIRGPIWLLEVFSAYLVRKLYRWRRSYTDALQRGEAPPEKFPPFVVVTDEAHNFAPKSFEISAPARGVFREIAQEGRKYGVLLILATQRPANMDETINAQLNTKVIFRTVRKSDMEVIQEETDMSRDEIARLPYLSSGTAFISSAVVGRTVAVRIRAARTQAPHTVNPFTELEEFGGNDREVWQAIAACLPLDKGQISLYLPDFERQLQCEVSFDEVCEWLDNFVAAGKLKEISGPFGSTYSLIGDGSTNADLIHD
jgi:hypothetical protein